MGMKAFVQKQVDKIDEALEKNRQFLKNRQQKQVDKDKANASDDMPMNESESDCVESDDSICHICKCKHDPPSEMLPLLLVAIMQMRSASEVTGAAAEKTSSRGGCGKVAGASV